MNTLPTNLQQLVSEALQSITSTFSNDVLNSTSNAI